VITILFLFVVSWWRAVAAWRLRKRVPFGPTDDVERFAVCHAPPSRGVVLEVHVPLWYQLVPPVWYCNTNGTNGTMVPWWRSPRVQVYTCPMVRTMVRTRVLIPWYHMVSS
jgi:hypothetical protein